AGTVWCGGRTPALSPSESEKNPLIFSGNLKTHKHEYKPKTHHHPRKAQIIQIAQTLCYKNIPPHHNLDEIWFWGFWF
ncbi:hypothetical protein, partial [Enterobacter asburiae]